MPLREGAQIPCAEAGEGAAGGEPFDKCTT